MRDITFGGVSLQLKVLLDAGLVERTTDGRRRVYHVRREALAPVAPVLEAMWNDALWRLKLQAELEESRRGPRAADHRTRHAPKGRAKPPHTRRRRRL